MAHVRQSRPNSGLGFQVKDLLLVTRAKKKKKKKKIDVDRLTRSHKWSILQRSSTKLCLSLLELTVGEDYAEWAVLDSVRKTSNRSSEEDQIEA
jgi:hypothetical protein